MMGLGAKYERYIDQGAQLQYSPLLDLYRAYQIYPAQICDRTKDFFIINKPETPCRDAKFLASGHFQHPEMVVVG